MQTILHHCDRCGRAIDQVTVPDPETGAPVALPVLVHLTMGVPASLPESEAIDLASLPLPESLRLLAEKPTSRDEWCVPCFIEAHGLALDWTGYQAARDRAVAVAAAEAAAVQAAADRDLATAQRIAREREALAATSGAPGASGPDTLDRVHQPPDAGGAVVGEAGSA